MQISDFTKKSIYYVMMFVILIGCLNLGIMGFFDYNILSQIEKLFNTGNIISRVIYIVMGVCALVFLVNRDVYLPFLGDTVFPTGLLKEEIPQNSNKQISVKVPPNSTVVYWAAEESNNEFNIKNPFEAYLKYENSGVVKSDKNGRAILKIRTPQSYATPRGKKLKPHVHYRYCKYPGMLSRVETETIDSKE